MNKKWRIFVWDRMIVFVLILSGCLPNDQAVDTSLNWYYRKIGSITAYKEDGSVEYWNTVLYTEPFTFMANGTFSFIKPNHEEPFLTGQLLEIDGVIHFVYDGTPDGIPLISNQWTHVYYNQGEEYSLQVWYGNTLPDPEIEP